MIIVSRNIRYTCGYSLGFLGEKASNDSGVVEEHNFHRLLLAMCGNFRHDMQDILHCVSKQSSPFWFSLQLSQMVINFNNIWQDCSRLSKFTANGNIPFITQ